MPPLEPQNRDDVWGQRRILTSLRIERAGLELLSTRGLDVTVDQIAAAAGISTRTFFRYFRNPRDVLTAVPARESRRMCEALLARPPDESLLEGFHAWFQQLGRSPDPSRETRRLEAEALSLWSRIVRSEPELVQSESRAMTAMTGELEHVVRQRLALAPDDADAVGVLSAAFAAVIWYVFTRTLDEDDAAEFSIRLDRAFELLGRLHLVSPALTSST